MRTVLNRSAGRASFILAIAGMVGSVAFPAVPALARAAGHHSQHPAVIKHQPGARTGNTVRLGPAVAYVRGKDGVVRRVR